MVERKLVVVANSGPLKELDNLCGPISSPVRITMDAIHKMVLNGKKVYECNPAAPGNEEMRVLLTIQNYDKDNFSSEPVAEIPKEPEQKSEPAEPQEPVVPEVKEPEVEDTPEVSDRGDDTVEDAPSEAPAETETENDYDEAGTEEDIEEQAAPDSEKPQNQGKGGKKGKHRH